MRRRRELARRRIGWIAAAVVAALGVTPARAQEVQVRIPEIRIPEIRISGFEMQDVRIPAIRVRIPINAVMREMNAALLTAGAAVDEALQNRDFRAEQTHQEKRSLAIGASGSLELSNISGDISVTAGSGTEAVIEIVRRSRGRTDADAKTGLERVKAIVEHRGDRATVRPDYPNERNAPYSVSIAYVVTAPAGTTVTISSISGGVTVKNMKAGLSVQLTSGPVTVSGGAGRAEVRTISGDVTVTDMSGDAGLEVGAISGNVLIERIKARRVSADVTSGGIIARDVTADAATIKSISGSVEYAGALAKGGRYELQTHSGSIAFRPTGSTGFDLQASTFSGGITPDASLGLKTVSTSRRSLRGSVGDGSAVVVLTAFSGNVTIARR